MTNMATRQGQREPNQGTEAGFWLYFLISALSYNLFSLMRQLLPGELSQHCDNATLAFVRHRGKRVRTGCQLLVKMRENHRTLLEQVRLALNMFEAPPI